MSLPNWRSLGRSRHDDRRSLWYVPSVATTRALGLTTGTFYFVAGLICLAHSFDLDIPLIRLRAIQAISIVAVVTGVALLAAGRHVPRWMYHALLAVGTGLITAKTMLGHGADTAEIEAITYILVMVAAAFFSSWGGMAAHTLLVCGSAIGALAFLGQTPAAIATFIGTFLCVGVVLAHLVRIADLADEDPLTALSNRRVLDKELDRAIEVAARDRGALSVIVLDLDHYKRINDALGHAAGDQLLVDCARQWQRIAPNPRLLCRYGGDEFAFLLPGYSLAQAARLADELRAALPGGTTASAGVASWDHGDTASLLMSRADVALYHAKSNGRNQTTVYGDPSHATRALEDAIRNGQLVMHYQPIVRLADGRVVSQEALVRWNHPEKGLLGPQTFVAVAERTGTIHALGAWTLEQACLAAAAATDPIRFSVNVSVVELRNPSYAELVATVLARTQLPPQRLVVEVTEAVYDNHDEQVGMSLRALRQSGVKIAIDDFGTGYSSLRWLSKFPVDILKIDGVFIEQMTSDGSNATILQALIALGRALGMIVVAERVETEQQARILRDLGCECAQGFYFGRPAPRLTESDADQPGHVVAAPVARLSGVYPVCS
ncbi:MAG: bifunctional diguanylate cyclase/phosphodiesterase [Acidobacteria bacterium]|nr:bifunctional diguanylate cyclase/phosphodiesterase [Acidobacteriota bacterium]